MATVTIKITDRLRDGTEGIRVEIESDPEFGDEKSETNAQRLGLDILEMILAASDDIQEVEESNDPDPSLN
jgi:hypothetical protein